MNTKKEEIPEKHVVFGSTGAYGSAIVRCLIRRGEYVVAVSRDEKRADSMFSGKAEIINADIMDQSQVLKACRDASVIYLGMNFPYSEWKEKYPIAIGNILKAIAGSNSLIVFPGNVYGYGKFQSVPVNEMHPLMAKSKKGVIRNSIEKELLENHRKGKFRVVLPRFADFYGPNVTNDLYGAMFRNALAGEYAIWPVNADTIHQFTYIDDAAEATMKLVDSPDTYGEVFHISGETITARNFISLIYRNVGRNPQLKVLHKALLTLIAIHNPQVRELLELLYEYEEPYALDDSKFRTRFPDFKYTSYQEGIKKTLEWLRNHAAEMA